MSTRPIALLAGAFAFAVELAALAAFVAGAYGLFPGNRPLGIGLAVVAAAVFITLWAVFLSPKAVRPLRPTARSLAKILLFALAAAGAERTWGPLAGLSLLLAGVVTAMYEVKPHGVHTFPRSGR